MRRGLSEPMKGSGKPQLSGQGYSPTSRTPSNPSKPGSENTSHLKTDVMTRKNRRGKISRELDFTLLLKYSTTNDRNYKNPFHSLNR